MKITRHGVTVRFFHTPTCGRESWTVTWHSSAGRHRVRKPTEREARELAETKADELSHGYTRTITAQERAGIDRANELIAPFGKPLETVAAEYAQIMVALKGVPPMEAIHYYNRRHTIHPMTVTEAVDEFLKGKKEAKRSVRHLEDLTSRLDRFKKAFNAPLSSVTERDLRDFLDKLALSPRSRNNFHAALVSFFRWAVKKKFLASDWNEFTSIEKIDDSEGEIEIFTVKEMTALLEHASDKLAPFLAIGAFAGLRSSEISRLDWPDIGVGQGKYIEVKARNARKTKQRRLVPISANLAAWLKPHKKEKGRFWPYGHFYIYELLRELTTASKVKWKHNALRHSRISYRMAEIQDASKVALESGNSPDVIFSNYRELVSPEQAAEWFSIMPKSAT